MKTQQNRNWSEYNNHLKNHASLDLFISQSILDSWTYQGRRKRGGKLIYWDSVIEMCLIVREYFGLGLRQTEGFIRSLFIKMGYNLRVPEYTTLSRRAAKLDIDLTRKALALGGDLVLAVDSTGLSIHRRDVWNTHKHGDKKRGMEIWRKLHLCVDTETGLILNASYTKANQHDCTQMPALLKDIPAHHIKAVAADKAYDTLNARRSIYEKKAAQLIPPINGARLSQSSSHFKKYGDIMKERDEAITYIKENAKNGDPADAIAQWSKNVGYHARSLSETAMFRVKMHTKAILTNRLEANRKTQTMIKCKLLNMLLTA